MYTKDDKVLLWLDLFENLTYKKKEYILDEFSSPTQLFDEFLSSRESLSQILTQKLYEQMAYSHNEKSLDSLVENLDKKGIKAVTIYSSDYPEYLLNTDCPPFVLYCKGDVALLKSKCFAIVGTRRITNYGRAITEKFTKGLVDTGFTIVSGLSCGVDTIAHQTTLDNGGKTIAVLAGGFDKIYPDINTNLANEIAKKGLLVTEIKPSEIAKNYYFPIRNRIIAGLSKGTLITEADEKSGAMYTKNYALEYGRDVFAVPGNITSSVSMGCNKIIVNGQAKAVCCLDDILDEYNIKFVPKKQESISVSMEEQIILDIIKDEEVSFQEILDRTKFDTKTLNTLLTTMSLNGLIKKLAGNLYSAK